MATNTPQPLRITIIGAGIAGLTCALALRRHNHHVTLLEKSTFHKETGAAMYASPNCSGHLIRLGWDPDAAGAIPVLGYLRILGETGQVATKMELAEVSQKWNQPWLMVHRVDLHEGLKRLCAEEDDGRGKGEKVDLRLGVKITGFDAEKGNVKLDDGTVFESDVIIGADGNNSIARKSVDSNMQLKPWGKSCYRFLLNKEVLMKDEEVKGMVEDDGYFLDVLANDRKFVAYPCRNNREINVAAFLPDEEMVGRGDDWEHEGNKAKMMKGFESFSPSIKKLLSYADEDFKVWQLVDMDQLKHWNQDRLALIGDAAHPFLPFLGQGAAQAVEDAICIATLLQPSTSASDVPDLMKLYDDIRRERVDYLQAWTRKNGQDEDKGRPPPEELFYMLDYSHKHDEWTNTQERLEAWRRGRGEDGVVDH